MAFQIDLKVYDAVPARLGPAVVVGKCDCGGDITKKYMKTVSVSVGPGRSRVHTFDVTCTKGGDACMHESSWPRRA